MTEPEHPMSDSAVLALAWRRTALALVAVVIAVGIAAIIVVVVTIRDRDAAVDEVNRAVDRVALICLPD